MLSWHQTEGVENMSFLVTMAAMMIGALWLGPKLKGMFTGGHLDDPVYKANLQRLIEHHRQFEKKE
jgi:hypothetical protein